MTIDLNLNYLAGFFKNSNVTDNNPETGDATVSDNSESQNTPSSERTDSAAYDNSTRDLTYDVVRSLLTQYGVVIVGTPTKTDERVVTGSDGHTRYYDSNNRLIKIEYKSGYYREYERDTNGNLLSSTTYKSDGTKYSYETYQNQSVFNSKDKVFKERTFYNADGTIKQTKVFSFKQDPDNKNQVIRTVTFKDASGKKTGKSTVSAMDKNKNVLSKDTYLKKSNGNGSYLYSHETYQSQNVFNSKSNVYKERTFYKEDGSVKETQVYNHKKDSDNPDNIIRTITYKDASGKKTGKTSVSVMDADKNVKTKSVVTKDAYGNVTDMKSYENGKLKTAIIQSKDADGNVTKKQEYYKYNDDGSKTVIVASFSVAADGTAKRNDGGVDSVLEYDSNGKLVSKTVYSGYINTDITPNGNNMDIPVRYNKRKIVIKYDKNGNEISITKEEYSNYKNGKRDVRVYNGTRDKSTGNIKYTEDTSLARTEESRQSHNPNNVTADDIIAKAKQYLGYSNADGTQYLFGTKNEWCCEFATYIYLELGIDLTNLKSRTWGKYVMDLAYQEGRFTDAKTAASTSKNNQAQMAESLKGQIILFGNDKTSDGTTTSSYQHTGLVEKVEYKDGKMIVYTIEGNSGHKTVQKKYVVDKDGNVVERYEYNGTTWKKLNTNGDPRIIGFADFLSE